MYEQVMLYVSLMVILKLLYCSRPHFQFSKTPHYPYWPKWGRFGIENNSLQLTPHKFMFDFLGFACNTEDLINANALVREKKLNRKTDLERLLQINISLNVTTRYVTTYSMQYMKVIANYILL